MSRVKMFLIAAALMASAMAAGAYASDYQGDEKAETASVFQKLGNFMTGKYVVDGKPLKDKGVIQVMADQVNDMKLSGTEEAASSVKVPEQKK